MATFLVMRSISGRQNRCGVAQTARSRSVQCSGLVEDILLKPITTAGQNPVLNEGIRTFYDQSSGLWEKEWGEHMHHGFYDPKSSIKKTRLQAQIDMIETTLDFAGITDIKSAVDVGCGIGGSSRYLASKFGCDTEGITLSPVQAQRAGEICGPRGLADRCRFQVGDALQQPFADNSFDFAWSMESGEHMPDKKKFVGEILRVTKPRGKVVIVTWCHRNLLAGEATLKPDELALLKRISEAYYLPPWCSLADYEDIFGAGAHAAENGVEDVKTADWSDNVAPFWGEVVESAVTPSGISGLLTAGWDTLKGALVMPMMQHGYTIGLIKFVAITGTVSSSSPESTTNGAGATE